MTSNPEVPLSTLEVYYLDDILGVFPSDFEQDFIDNFLQGSDISFGDAEYTVVHGSRIADLLSQCWEECGYEERGEGDPWAALPQLDEPGVLVAIVG